MPGPFPCPTPPSKCDTNANPLTEFSSEAPDSTTFIGLAWSNQLPPLDKPFNVVPCEAITESQISQADADRQAQNLVVACASPCDPTFTNTSQTAVGHCGDGSAYFFTIGPGQYVAANQVLADRLAFTAAVQALLGHSLCLGGLAPVSVCRGEFYFGQISILSSDPITSVIISDGELPDGLSMVVQSDRVVIEGTPTSFGNVSFTLMATNSVGVFTSKTYQISVIGIVTGSPLPDGSTGNAYDIQLQAVLPDGATPIWSVTAGVLPDGLSLDANTGDIAGTPTTAEDSAFTVSVTAGSAACSKDFAIHIANSSNICNDGISGLAANRYGIQGYFDGMIANPVGGPSGNPAWDGSFPFYMDGLAPEAGFNGWATGGFANPMSIDGNSNCNVAILFAGCIAGVPQWQIWISDFTNQTPASQLWYGEKAGGQTPEGVYNLVNGTDAAPLALTIVLLDMTATPNVNGLSCAS